MIGGLVLAGGEGRRFGGGKLLAELGGRALVEHPIAALEAAGLERIVLVLGADAERIGDELDPGPAEVVVAEHWAEGQAASLAAGVGALQEAEAIVLVLGDQPLIAPQAIERVIGARRPDALAVRATYEGTPAHPTVLERALFGHLLELEGDIGARRLLTEVASIEVPCDGLGSPIDIDTPDDLERARSGWAAGSSS